MVDDEKGSEWFEDGYGRVSDDDLSTDYDPGMLGDVCVPGPSFFLVARPRSAVLVDRELPGEV